MGEQDIVITTAHQHRERSVDWYWGLGFIALGGAVVSVLVGNTLLAIILVLGMGSIGILAAREPREHLVRIDARGVSVDGTRYPFTSIHSFWVEHEAAEPRLFLSMSGVLAPHFSFKLRDEAQGNDVRTLLKHSVKEEEQGPHLGEHVAEIFGL